MIRERLLDIDRATGVAIAMVVLGHLASDKNHYGAEWYYTLKTILYTFHMPFFMYLSGIITYYTFKPIEGIQDYKDYVSKKFMRFMPAYLLFSVIIFVGKIIAAHFLDIDNPITSVFDYFEVLYLPQQSFNMSLWYIYVLFELCVFFSFFLLLFKKIEYLLIPAVIVHFIHVPGVMALGLLCEYLLYFTIGCICVKYYPVYTRYLDKTGWVFLISWLGILAYCYYYINLYQSPVSIPLPKTLIGLLSIPALHYLVRLPGCQKMRLLAYVGTFSFPIYLMNTIVIGTFKGMTFKFTTWDYHQFYIMVPFLFLGGLFIPVAIKNYLLRHVPSLNKIIY
jgi:fucose 4-O-acetylase-like acetyltransferase